MDLDYYAILGVPSEADIEALRQAYRKRAFEYHPDCGGSHEQMVLINEAWAILSNPITRRHYDSARRNRSDYVAQRSVREDAQAARQKAQEYPRKWPDFEAWLDRMFRDFTEVNYGTTEAGFGMQYPTAGRSVSGWLLIIAGGLFGLFVGSYIIFSLNIEHPIGRVLGLSCMVGGAWLGVLLHDKIGKSLGKKEKVKLYQKKKNIITNDQKSKKNDQKLREQRERLKDPDGFTLKERQEWERLLEEERVQQREKKGMVHKDVDELSDAGWFLKAHSLWNYEKGNFYKPQEALKYLDQAIKLNPNKGEAYGSRGIAYFQLGKYNLSVENHTRAIKIDPKDIMNYINRAHAYFQLRMYEKAIEDTIQATGLDPNATVSYAVRAGFYSQLEKHDLVIKEYDQIICLDPNNAAYYYARGWNYAVKLDDHQKAIEDYNQAIRLDSNQPLLYIARGKSYSILRDFERMCKDYKKACDLGDCESLQIAKKQGYCL